MNWCDYETAHVGKCMASAILGTNRCKRHKDKKQREKRTKIGHYSGDSKHRVKEGQFQAKAGR